MPVMNGLEVAPRLRMLFPKAPIILFTLHADSVLKTDAGVNLVLLKITAFHACRKSTRDYGRLDRPVKP